MLSTFDYLIENFQKHETKNYISFLYSKFDFYELEKIIGTIKTTEFINPKNRFKLTTIN